MTDDTFPSLMAALKYLQAEGYDIQKSKIYQDRKDGLIRMEPDGRRVRESEILSYVVKAGLRRQGSMSPEEMEAHAAEKIKAELDKIREQTRTIILDRAIKEGKYVLKEQSTRDRVDMLTVMEVHFRQVIDVHMPEWIAAAGGDAARVNEAISAANGNLDAMMDALARSDGFEIEYGVVEMDPNSD